MNDTQSSNTSLEKPKKKKKWLWVLAGAVFLLVIISASGGGDGDSKTDQASSDKVYAMNEEVNSRDVIWKAIKVRDRGNTLKASESRYAAIAKTKTTAGRFIEVTFSVENRQKDLASITDPKLVDSTGREFTSSSDTSEWIPEGKEFFLLSNLQPNLPKEFIVIYEVPADASGFKLKVGVIKPQLIELGI